jgi:hypothetical protein
VIPRKLDLKRLFFLQNATFNREKWENDEPMDSEGFSHLSPEIFRPNSPPAMFSELVPILCALVADEIVGQVQMNQCLVPSQSFAQGLEQLMAISWGPWHNQYKHGRSWDNFWVCVGYAQEIREKIGFEQ